MPMAHQIATSNEPQLLVAGGDADPNLAAVLACLQKRAVPHEALLVGAHSHPRVTWDLDQDVLWINETAYCPSALFIRYDVFTSLAEGRPEPAQRALSWFTTVAGWAFAHPEVRLFNRARAQHATNKLLVLRIAQELGFDIPSTLVSNDLALLSHNLEQRALVVKPVAGGDYTQELPDVLDTAPVVNGSLPAPAIVQERLVPPEIRVYRIHQRCFAYQLVADALDYRSTTDCAVIPVAESDLPDGLTDRLATLMDRLQMDFGAADFKACPHTGQLQFLEINDGPMFAAFDAVSGGCLTDALVDFLCQ
ncbi:MAG: hypothetical protein OEU26_12960 [Candidatus Tectomicrobia bacterium]|nr:hypothetical protein [Candidatus Tectomicrobia bacterium]